jgi:hypothetical protein
MVRTYDLIITCLLAVVGVLSGLAVCVWILPNKLPEACILGAVFILIICGLGIAQYYIRGGCQPEDAPERLLD